MTNAGSADSPDAASLQDNREDGIEGHNRRARFLVILCGTWLQGCSSLLASFLYAYRLLAVAHSPYKLRRLCQRLQERAGMAPQQGSSQSVALVL